MECIVRRRNCGSFPACQSELGCRMFRDLCKGLDFAPLQIIAEYGYIAHAQGLSVVDMQLKLRDIIKE